MKMRLYTEALVTPVIKNMVGQKYLKQSLSKRMARYERWTVS